MISICLMVLGDYRITLKLLLVIIVCGLEDLSHLNVCFQFPLSDCITYISFYAVSHVDWFYKAARGNDKN